MFHCHQSYADIYMMPITERKFFINKVKLQLEPTTDAKTSNKDKENIKRNISKIGI